MSAPGAPSAIDLARAVRAGERSALDAVEASLDAIERLDGRLGAFASVDGEGARARARELDRRRAEGEPLGTLAGVPVALKSNFCLAGAESHCGSRVLAGYRAPYTATAVARLLEADAVPIGMTHMDEFGMGSSSENSAFGPVRNPWDPTRTPGGSSSGSAVAIAAGMVPLALGSDTGGSARQPAALCGIVGFKPTYGRVSRYGLVAFASSLDQVSALARGAHDAALLASVVSGHDPADSTSADLPSIEVPAAASVAGLRVGVPAEWFPPELESGVRASVEAALAALESRGAELVPLALPCSVHAVSAYYVVATAEASSNLARYDGVRYGARAAGDGSLQGMFAATREAGFGPEVKRRVLLGTYVLSSGYYEAWYGRALRVRRLIADELTAAFERVDVIAGPTSPTPAFRLGERTDDPLAMYLSDVFTTPASLAGLPAASVPCAPVEVDGRPLPVGLQLVGPALGDARVLAVARAFEDLAARGAAPPDLSASGR